MSSNEAEELLIVELRSAFRLTASDRRLHFKQMTQKYSRRVCGASSVDCQPNTSQLISMEIGTQLKARLNKI
jgi:hypothetical protein